MAKAFVIGLGGTGARVLRSITMLLSAGVETNGYEIVPVLIDIDVTNGDATRSIDYVENYEDLKRKLKNYGIQPEVLCKVALNPRNNNQDRYRLNFFRQDTSTKFKKFIGYTEEDGVTIAMDDLNKDFIDSLFSTSEDKGKQELELELERGFKGHPNIGTVVFNSIEENSEFLDLISSFKGSGNKVFFISSLFGGTGASGFPQLLKLIQTSNEKGIDLSSVEIGALCAMPYFNVEAQAKDGDNSIKSDSFMAKTAAALASYDKSHISERLNAMYLMYDERKKAQTNASGSVDQKNDAHWVELSGAYAFFHFLKKEKNALHTYLFHTKYEGERPPNVYDITNFSENDQKGWLHPIIKLGIARFVTHKYLKNWTEEKVGFYEDLKVENLQDFINTLCRHFEFFERKTEEITRNERQLQLFDFSKNDIWDYMSLLKIGETKKKDFEDVIGKLNVISKVIRTEKIKPQAKLYKFIEESTNWFFEQIMGIDNKQKGETQN